MRSELLAEVEAFWPHYLRHHSHPLNRALHYAADMAVVAGVILGCRHGRLSPVLLGAAAGLALVTIGHTLVEGNSPLVFRRPILATICNVRMAVRALRGT
jgi:hypothetical protein